MSALTFRLSEQKHQRLKEMAQQHNISVNQLLDETVSLLLAEHDAHTRFLARAALGKNQIERGLDLLRKARE